MTSLNTRYAGIKLFSTGQSAAKTAQSDMAQFLFFGRFTDVSAGFTRDIPDDVQSSADIARYLCETLDGFKAEWNRAGARMAVNHVLVIDSAPVTVSHDDEIAFMSALSGG